LASGSSEQRRATHWKRLGLIPGAPECVIKAAHLVQITLHHPDRGGDADTAKQINIAYDELKGSGSAANEYVAANYNGEPWVVLGITSAADSTLVQRAGKQLASEVKSLPRLAERVAWAMANFASVKPTPAKAKWTAPAPAPALQRGPRGLESWINLGELYWQEPKTYTMQLTWPDAVPHRIAISCSGPVRAQLRRSAAAPSRCDLDISVDWDAAGLKPGKRRVVSAMVSIKWPGSRGFTTKVAATVSPHAGSRPGADAPAPHEAQREQPTPGVPDGLPLKVDFGKLAWRSDTTRTMQLTWTAFAPYAIDVIAAAPVRAEVTASKVMPGRFSVALSIDWSAGEFAPGPTVRGYTLDAPVTVRWAAGAEAEVRVKGLILYPPLVSASPAAIDLGTIEMQGAARASLVLISSAATDVEIEPTPWLRRVDGSGRKLDAPLRLATNVPMRVEFRVHWEPIAERAGASFSAGKPVRPTGRITIRWDGRAIEVPVQMTVPPPTGKRR
jgi:hypothetical protein